MRGTPFVCALAALALAGCGKKKQVAGTPRDAAVVATDDAATSAPPPPADSGRLSRQELGAVSAEPVTEPESRPAIALAGTSPAVAYRRGDATHVARLDASGWRPLPGAPCRDLDHLALAADANGELVLVGADGDGTSCAAATAGGAWTGGAAVGKVAGQVAGVRVVATAHGVVAALHHRGDRGDGLTLFRWGGAKWTELAKLAVGDGRRVSSFDLAGAGDDVAVAWVERVPQQPVEARARRVNAASGATTDLPALEQIDGDTRLRLAAAADGALLLARTWNPGFKEVLRLPPAGTAWIALGAPPGNRGFTAHGLPAVAAGPGGEPVLAWAGERIDVALHARPWIDVATGLGGHPNGQDELVVTAAADGTIALAWRERDPAGAQPARIKAALLVPVTR